MSAGAYNSSKYQASYGDGTNIHPIRVQPETISAVIGGTSNNNEPPSAAVSNPISAKVSRGGRGLGLKPRTVTLKFTGTVPTGYKAGAVIVIPWLKPFPLAVVKGATGTYLNSTVVVVAVNPEKVG